MKKEKIFVVPEKGLKVLFEGTNQAIPEEGAEVFLSLYYKGRINEKALKIQKKKKETPKKEL